MRPWTLGSERSKESSAPASTPRAASGSTAKTKNIQAAASARRSRLGALARIAIDNPAREPAKRRGGQREREHDRGHADLQRQRRPLADRAEPVADQAPHHRGVDREFPPDSGPELRIEDARRAGECLARKQLAPRRADAGREVVGLQQHGAGGAQVGVEPVVPLFLALEFLGRDVGRGRGLARFGR